MRYRLSLLTIMALMPCLIFAATLSVKQDGSGDYTVIQAALDAASLGDTVLVHPGRYFENLTIQTSNITLTSLEGTTGDPAYIDSTIIDGNDSDPCVVVAQHVLNDIIRGFSITRGFRGEGNVESQMLV
jgi:pectin methylesterase-like acyl-CoA thioesterase